ncbi:TIGR04100 family radical SAM protein [Ethanoligenens harbinense]|uniref:Radical SAM domain protein n=1 Tax=Ethanoligenens harbinense (strain DSM 18485 / JCM 12961 / CGMCC 1.5033 / YUAN-3) TaxID=663278 RepID=E6U719_ETHHY|nr:TIGR04100 family radical SAM protein [Ethanoligenens harbinense]ADU28089.1 Radical SAM domain protein [Ethanoligenens harbinense YUAN-3]AVQ97099.1 TIGR04100 family radical SAM protein [Ethanoligenens harbinense YUAN-3]AYF39761.1 TIGR04100 family radical SAM protein [Ethanoligenens harbinense]AYF42594.1 TIGR04100 family radical SAM protein [Ethanoligenens harbinense]QCN93342.1 TIGR04100 family radical SAM protein [Ethanoligenens harbinense]
MTITYPVHDGLYVNVTNRCPDHCTFCIRNEGDGAYGSGSLWLEREPSVEEIVDAIFANDLSKYKELVFCGYGEPLERLDAVKDVIRRAKEKAPGLPVRINTNGLADLIHGRATAKELAGLADAVSISLNAPDAATYQHYCRSDFGRAAYDAVLAYARDCMRYIPSVTMTVLDLLTPAQIEESRAIAASIGAKFRVRAYEA